MKSCGKTWVNTTSRGRSLEKKSHQRAPVYEPSHRCLAAYLSWYLNGRVSDTCVAMLRMGWRPEKNFHILNHSTIIDRPGGILGGPPSKLRWQKANKEEEDYTRVQDRILEKKSLSYHKYMVLNLLIHFKIKQFFLMFIFFYVFRLSARIL